MHQRHACSTFTQNASRMYGRFHARIIGWWGFDLASCLMCWMSMRQMFPEDSTHSVYFIYGPNYVWPLSVETRMSQCDCKEHTFDAGETDSGDAASAFPARAPAAQEQPPHAPSPCASRTASDGTEAGPYASCLLQRWEPSRWEIPWSFEFPVLCLFHQQGQAVHSFRRRASRAPMPKWAAVVPCGRKRHIRISSDVAFKQKVHRSEDGGVYRKKTGPKLQRQILDLSKK